MFGAGDWDAILREYAVDLALVKKDAPDDHLLKLRPDWRLIFEDAQSVLYGKQGSEMTRRLLELTDDIKIEEEVLYFP